MYDAFGALYAGFAGDLKGHLKARKQVWILLIALMATLAITAFMIWSSAPGYTNILPDVPAMEIVAWSLATLMSLYLAIAMAYSTGYLVERVRKVPAEDASYDGLTFLIVLLTIIGFGTVEYNMQMIGAEANAKVIAGVKQSYVYKDDALQQRITSTQQTLNDLRAGRIERGTAGWYDKKSKAYILNETGKAKVAQYEADLARMNKEDADSRATKRKEVDEANAEREKVAATWDSNIANGALFGYPLLMFLGFVLGNSTEVIQLAIRKGKMQSAAPDESGTTARTQPTQPVRSVDEIVQEKLDAMAARFAPAAQPVGHMGYHTTYQPPIPKDDGTAGRVNQQLPGDMYAGNTMQRTSTHLLQQYTQAVQMPDYGSMTEKELRAARSRLKSNLSTYLPRAEGKPSDNNNVRKVNQITAEMDVIDEKLKRFTDQG